MAGPGRSRRPEAPTPADLVTGGRGLLVLACAVLVGLALSSGESPRTWWLAAIAALAWALDGVDGFVARRTGTETVHGARLDSGVDGALVLVMAVALVQVAPWGLVGGLLYPAFLLGQLVRPAWRRSLPGSWRGKVAGGALTGTLVVATAPFWPVWAVQVAVAVAVALVVWSFAVDVAWLERQRDRAT